MSSFVNLALMITASNFVVLGSVLMFFVAYRWIKSLLIKTVNDSTNWDLRDIRI